MNQRVKPALAVVLVGMLAWMLYTQLSGVSLLPGSEVPDLPGEPDVKQLGDLEDIASVAPKAVLGGAPTYDLGGRNLFQYGTIKPPPPSPEELERMRKAEEARLKALEDQARERQAAEAAARAAREAAAQQAREVAEQQRAKAPPPVAEPKAPPKPPPPPIDLKLVGYLGPPEAKIAVFYAPKSKEIVLGKKGEVIEGKFTVLDIGVESVDMGYADPAHAGSKKTIQMGK